MQKDIHYYGTYAIARAAGLKPKDAQVIAYSAQFVDDSTMTDSQMHEDGGLLYGVATAHHPYLQVPKQYFGYKIREWFNKKCKGKKIANLKQRRMWIPFHFYPGNEGDTLSKRLICRKNSSLVNEMFDNHISHVKNFPYILQLIGIASHVYMDTFSHYGFSGVSSRSNKVKTASFKFKIDAREKKMEEYSKFHKKYKKENFIKNWRDNNYWIKKIWNRLKSGFKSSVAEIGSGALGHGAVATFPDQPYLKWGFEYEKRNEVSERKNPQTYLEGCENLYIKLKQFSNLYYDTDPSTHSGFFSIKESIKEILSFNGAEEKRINKWLDGINKDKLFHTKGEKEFLHYDATEWRNQKKEFHKLKKSSEVVNLPIYKFHQAADYHRHYTLKHLLPKYGIVVN